MHILGYLFSGGGLLLDRRGNAGDDCIDIGNNRADLIDFPHSNTSYLLNALDLVLDIKSRFGGLFSQVFDFIGHNGKTLTRFACSGGLDGCIKRQKVCLI